MVPDKKQRGFKTKILGLLSIVAIVLIASLGGSLAKLGVKEFLAPKILTKEEVLQKTVKDLRKKLPIRIDEKTTLIHVMADAHEYTIIYEYLIENVKIVDEKQKQRVTRELKKNIMKMCQIPDAFKYDLKYKWSYLFPASGEDVRLDLEKADCNKNK